MVPYQRPGHESAIAVKQQSGVITDITQGSGELPGAAKECQPRVSSSAAHAACVVRPSGRRLDPRVPQVDPIKSLFYKRERMAIAKAQKAAGSAMKKPAAAMVVKKPAAATRVAKKPAAATKAMARQAAVMKVMVECAPRVRRASGRNYPSNAFDMILFKPMRSCGRVAKHALAHPTAFPTMRT